ncbi:ATM interactor-like [Acipenser oxyrinchus oxyrinchus]|uniref:ATM interactor-like n=1 Tax=Acipenser oxyrinchus oxyrinchus TaxID=40147 RepID=A0AAD8D4H9_ACIOX|nr:ATM interactor-like [Acipenser oxyrinchus oxyrinchus]
MAVSAPSRRGAHPQRNNTTNINPNNSQSNSQDPSQPWEMIKPSITELTKEVRTNILCTVEGCGKILPNTPALNMHLVKSHRIQDGMVNPTVRKKKDIKASQKLYCCPMEGCPRGPNRPFSQFSLVKQHFMKMHAEKKYKCAKCSNSYSTEWDLKRHSEDCGKMYQCTCGCPYACRAALLSHIYRTGHEIPAEHRYPPVKKRKMEGPLGGAPKQKPNEQMFQIVSIEQNLSEVYVAPSGPCQSNVGNQNPTPTKTIQKLLLPKPRVALVKVPAMQFAHVPIIVSSADHSIKPVVLAVDNQGSVISTVHLLPQSMGTLDTKALTFRDTMPMSGLALEPVSTGVQVNLEAMASNQNILAEMGHRNKSISTNIQTDISYLSKGSTPAISCPVSDSSVSSCAQTDISVSAQVMLPINVQTQTFPSPYKMTSSIGAQTDAFGQTYCPSYAVTRETQTSTNLSTTECREHQMDQAVMCADIFENDSSYSVSTQTSLKSNCLTENVDQHLTSSSNPSLFDEKSVDVMCFSAQTSLLPQHPVADNQTQTMNLFSNLENILSDSMTGHSLDNHGPLSDASTRCEVGLTSVQEQNTGIDFDFEEFLNAAHTQTQTEESELGTLNSEPVLESLDIETQTDFLFYNDHAPNYSNRVQWNYLGLDTQTQTDLNFLLDTSSHIPLGNFLKQSSFPMSMESSDTETQTEVHPALRCNPSHESQVKSNSTETQTITSCFGSLGNLFLTSNETQTVMDDFLVADVAWNTLESHFSSVETQTCEEVSSLFHHSDKTNSLI